MAEEALLQVGCRSLLHPGYDVRIGVEGHTDCAMTEALLDDLWVDALLEKERSMAVPEVVKPDAWHAGSFRDAR